MIEGPRVAFNALDRTPSVLLNTKQLQNVTHSTKEGLTMEQREQTALVRMIGACGNRQKCKEKCDPGNPCRQYLEHYKDGLVIHPRRDEESTHRLGKKRDFISCG